MNRHPLHFAIAAALIASLALAGCKKNADDATAVTPPASTPGPAEPMTPAPTDQDAMGQTPATPAATALTVTTVDLGNAVGTDNRVTAPLTTFAGTDTIHAAVATDGPVAGNLTARWSFEDGQVIDTQDKSVAAGPQVTDFSVSKPDGWPAGHYKLEILTDGAVVQTREFDVE